MIGWERSTAAWVGVRVNLGLKPPEWSKRNCPPNPVKCLTSRERAAPGEASCQEASLGMVTSSKIWYHGETCRSQFSPPGHGVQPPRQNFGHILDLIVLQSRGPLSLCWCRREVTPVQGLGLHLQQWGQRSSVRPLITFAISSLVTEQHVHRFPGQGL